MKTLPTKVAYTTLLILGFLILSTSNHVSAQVNTQQRDTQTTREELQTQRAENKDELTERKKVLQNNIEEKRETTAEKLQQVSQSRNERIEQYVHRVIQRFESAIERIEMFVYRIDSRKEKLIARGLSFPKTDQALLAVEASLSTARTSVSEALDLGSNILQNENPRAVFSEMKSTLRSAHQDIKEAHSAVTRAVQTLSEELEEQSGTQQSTTTPNN